MTASITFYQSFRKYLGDGTIDLDSNAFKVALTSSTYTPSASAHTIYSDLTNELSTANGYTAGGASLGSVTWTQATVTLTFDAADTVWTASGGSITARYAVIYVNATVNTIVKPLVCYILLDTTPADVTATDTNTLTLQWNASGIFTLT
jgi:hypothetical protein